MPMDDVDENAAEDDDDKDDRKPQRIWDKHVAPETELSDSCVAPPPLLPPPGSFASEATDPLLVSCGTGIGR